MLRSEEASLLRRVAEEVATGRTKQTRIEHRRGALRRYLDDAVPGMRLLESLPGVGFILAATIALEVLHGIGRYSALLVVAEIGEPERFRNARQVGAYAGLTARVHQSGKTEHRGGISKQGSRWLRWIPGAPGPRGRGTKVGRHLLGAAAPVAAGADGRLTAEETSNACMAGIEARSWGLATRGREAP